MLSKLFILATSLVSVCSEDGVKSYEFPFPFELPTRNDRAQQCWLRIQDTELVATLAIYCYLAEEFLRNHIRDYNSRKILEDKVDVSLWSEQPRSEEDERRDLTLPIDSLTSNGNKLRDWKVTTVRDPVTCIRLYVSQKADCSVIMYNREGMTNYKVTCAKVLYFLNMHGGVPGLYANINFIIFGVAISLLLNLNEYWIK